MSSSGNAIYNTIGASISGVTNTLSVTNPSNTASSAARETITVGGGSAGDPTLNFNVSGVTDWEMGADNSDSDKFKLSQSTALGTKDTFVMNVNGQRTLPLQASFLAYSSSIKSNITGDGTIYDVVYNTTLYDINSNYSAPSFTAPITGIYLFTYSVNLTGFSAAYNRGALWLQHSNGNQYLGWRLNPAIMADGATTDLSGTATIMMAQGESIKVQVFVGTGAKTISLTGNTLAVGSPYFSGCLIH